MTVTVTEYSDLVTSEHSDKPKFMALVEAGVSLPVDGRNLLQEMPGDFDVDVAVGVQLDAVGQWVGLSRTITIEPSVAYPTPATPYQVELDDTTFRRLIKARALANRWDGTPEGAVDILDAFYGPAGTAAAIRDNQDMSISLLLAGTRPTAAEAAVFSQMLLPLRPSGVRIKDTEISPVGGALFGLDFANEFINGPDFGSFGEPF